jgi:hypothetical protein
MKNGLLFFKFILYYIILFVITVIFILFIGNLTEYQFSGQIGLAIMFWGIVPTTLLAIVGVIHNLILLILFIIRKIKHN